MHESEFILGQVAFVRAALPDTAIIFTLRSADEGGGAYTAFGYSPLFLDSFLELLALSVAEASMQ